VNRISEITKRDILDLFQNGIDIDEVFETKKVTYPYFGQMDEVDFLKRLYDLKSMPSFDSRFSNAEDDIWQHTVNNDDYPYCWVFEDERLQLKNGNDEIYLRFICEIFHPAVRFEKGYWKDFLAEINKLLQHDGYELYPAEKVSNRDVYSWKLYQPESVIFVPFSQRKRNAIKQKQIVFKIKREARNQIYQIFERYDYRDRKISDTGWQYDVLVSDEVLYDITKFYTPKCFNKENQYVETNSLKDFILFTSPYCVIDAIEFFDKYCNSDFTAEINTIFNLNEISLKLNNGKVESIVDSHITNSSLASIGETGLKELIQEANRYYEKENLKIAVEKLWDAFERLKTYYSPTLDKKKSVNRIIDDMSGNKEPFKKMFDKEFYDLTTIGNNFRIRHHETTKVDIEDGRHYDYFYKRCLSLITTAIRYLDNGGVI
jgi:DNA-binding cell septation regulator SpoVG